MDSTVLVTIGAYLIGSLSFAVIVSRAFGLADDAELLNRHGGALAFGHPLGASGARLALRVMNEIAAGEARHAIVSLCVGVGQGLALGLAPAEPL